MKRNEIRSDVSGTVFSVLAKAGDSVAEGDTLALIEAMKMEIPVTAPAAGKLVELRISEGETVAENDLVAVVEA